MMYVDLTELDEVFRGRWLWSSRRPAPAWLRRADYLGDPRVSLERAVRDRVQQQTGERPDGPIRMLTHLRYFGYAFNPVTFYYCFDAADRHVVATVAEITNTPWNERYSYVLKADVPRPGAGAALSFRQEVPRVAIHGDGPRLRLVVQRPWRPAERSHDQPA